MALPAVFASASGITLRQTRTRTRRSSSPRDQNSVLRNKPCADVSGRQKNRERGDPKPKWRRQHQVVCDSGQSEQGAEHKGVPAWRLSAYQGGKESTRHTPQRPPDKDNRERADGSTGQYRL